MRMKLKQIAKKNDLIFLNSPSSVKYDQWCLNDGSIRMQGL